MINPVNNYYQPNYNETKTKQVSASGESEKFSLNAGLAQEKEKDATSKAEENDEGVTYEHGMERSGQFLGGRDSYTGAESESLNMPESSGTGTSASGIFNRIKEFARRVIFSVREIFSAIWEEKPIPSFSETFEKELAENESVEKTQDRELLTGETLAKSEDVTYDNLDKKRDDYIRQALKDGDRATFRNLISEDGSRIPAKNSSILTYYDAHGKIVDIDPSEKQRILHTDKNVRKL